MWVYSVDQARSMIWIVDLWHSAQLPTYPNLRDADAP